MKLKRTCRNICKKFMVKKPAVGGRYAIGQVRCQTCDIWMDYRGGHLKDGSQASDSSPAWFCNCCNFKVRKNPRNIGYKTRIRRSAGSSRVNRSEENHIDISYFSNLRAGMLRELGRAIVARRASGRTCGVDHFLPDSMPRTDIETEFDASLERILDLACADTPNKASLIAEFEAVRHRLDCVPTKQDMSRHSRFGLPQYEAEFQSWEHMLDRMGYDPFYKKTTGVKRQNARHHARRDYKGGTSEDEASDETLDSLRESLRNCLRGKPDMLSLFDTIDQCIAKMDADEIAALEPSTGSD